MVFEEYFKGKRVIITGAGRGIGKALVARLYAYEAIVFAVSKNPQTLEALKKEFPEITTRAVDLEDWNATEAAIESIGPVHFLVNNAGVLDYGDFLSITPAGIDRIFNTNFKAVIKVSQVVAQKMISAGSGGSIVNMSSLAAKKALPGISLYCSSKAALDMLTKMMAVELGPHQIRVNCVNPGTIETDMLAELMGHVNQKLAPIGTSLEEQMVARIPLGRGNIEMSEIVNLTLFVLSNMAPMIHGESIVLDGGYSLT